MQKPNSQSHLHEELIELVKQERRITSKILDLLQQVENKAKLDQGSLSLTTLARASRVLNTKSVAEKRSLLLELQNKSTREVDKILAPEMPTEKIPGPAKRYVTESKVIINLDFTENEFENLDRLKALKSHQVKDFKDLIIQSVAQCGRNDPANLQVLCQLCRAHNHFKYMNEN